MTSDLKAAVTLVSETAPTYMEMEDLARYIDTANLDGWAKKIINRMRDSLNDLAALKAGIYRCHALPKTQTSPPPPPAAA
jgi:hypothetical protein